MTIPNLLTLARICLTALLAWLLLRQSMTAAFIVFFIAGLTDALDGLLARVLDQKSRLGSYIDPVADKLLLVTAFFLLWKIGEIPLWLLLIIVGRDLLILCGFFVLYFSRVQFEIKPLVSSKLTTMFQLGTVFTLLGRSFLELSGWIYSILFVTTAGFSILSGGQYLLNGLSLLKRHRSGNTAQ
ncbi:MAG: CDP-alcohol phosphatidyltransferase family protein [Syntrophobacteraceae bacterium]|jgi:cardiolipin synthase